MDLDLRDVFLGRPWKRAVVESRSSKHVACEFLVGGGMLRVARVGLFCVRGTRLRGDAQVGRGLTAQLLLRVRADKEVLLKIDDNVQDEHERKGVERCAREREHDRVKLYSVVLTL